MDVDMALPQGVVGRYCEPVFSFACCGGGGGVWSVS